MDARSRLLWRTWAVAATSLTLLLSFLLLADAEEWAGRGLPVKTAFSPGDLSDGHYQFAERCDLCHRPAGETLQDACVDCHQSGLDHARDTHAPGLFTNVHADELARIEARQCITCHTEHQPEITDRNSVSVSPRFCRECHGRIIHTSASHVGLTFDLCLGCHNYHDNRVQDPAFRNHHDGAPGLLADPRVPVRDGHTGRAPLPDATTGIENCSDCHPAAVESFLEGRKGMRLALALPPLTPGESRAAMKADAAHRPLHCNACHDPHRGDPPAIAVDTCLGCHDSAHARSYSGSPHHRLWQQELAGELPPGSGVSCATCHFPREKGEDGRIHSHHNPSRDLRPSDRMAATVCMHCHGLSFSLDALADRDQLQRNFREPPVARIHSIREQLETGPPSLP